MPMYAGNKQKSSRSTEELFDKLLGNVYEDQYDPAAIKDYLDNGGDPELRSDKRNCSLLEYASMLGRTAIVALLIPLIEKHKKLPTIVKAIYLGDLKSFQEALSSITNIHDTIHDDHSVLTLTVLAGQHKMVDLLIEKDINSFKNFRGNFLTNKVPPRIAKIFYLKIQHLKTRQNINDSFKAHANNGFTSSMFTLLLGNVNIDAANTQGFTALMLSAQAKHVQIFRLLLLFNASHNARTLCGHSVLHCAVMGGSREIVAILLGITPVNKINIENKDKINPLMLSVQNGNEEVTQLLLDTKAFDLNVILPLGKTLLFHAVALNKPVIVQQLIKAGADVNIAQTVDLKSCPLLFAVSNGFEAVLKVLFEVRTLNYHARNLLGEAAPRVAVQFKYSRILELLLATQQYNDDEIFEALFQAMASKSTPLTSIILNYIPTLDVIVRVRRIPPLFFAIGLQNVDITQLLLTKGASPNYGGDIMGHTPLQISAGHKSLPVVKALLDAGANPHDRRADGSTALSLAAKENSLDILEALLNAMKSDPTHLRQDITYAQRASFDKFECSKRLLQEKLKMDFATIFDDSAHPEGFFSAFFDRFAEGLATFRAQYSDDDFLHFDILPNENEPSDVITLHFSPERFQKVVMTLLGDYKNTKTLITAVNMINVIWTTSSEKPKYEAAKVAMAENTQNRKIIEDANKLSDKFQDLSGSNNNCDAIAEKTNLIFNEISTSVANLEQALNAQAKNASKKDWQKSISEGSQRRLAEAKSYIEKAREIQQEAMRLVQKFESDEQQLLQACEIGNFPAADAILQGMKPIYVNYLGLRSKLLDNQKSLAAIQSGLKQDIEKTDKRVQAALKTQEKALSQAQIKQAAQVRTETQKALDQEQEKKAMGEKTAALELRKTQQTTRVETYKKLKAQAQEKAKALRETIEERSTNPDTIRTMPQGYLPSFSLTKPQPFTLDSATALGPRLTVQDELQTLKNVLLKIQHPSTESEVKKTLEFLKIERNALLGALGRTFEFLQQLPPAFKLPDKITTILRDYIFHGEVLKPLDENDTKLQAELNGKILSMVLDLVEFIQTSQASALGATASTQAAIERLPNELFQDLLLAANKLAHQHATNTDNLITLDEYQKHTDQIELGERELVLYHHNLDVNRDVLRLAIGCTLARLGCFAANMRDFCPQDYRNNKSQFDCYIQFGRKFRHEETYPDPFAILAQLMQSAESTEIVQPRQTSLRNHSLMGP